MRPGVERGREFFRRDPSWTFREEVRDANEREPSVEGQPELPS